MLNRRNILPVIAFLFVSSLPALAVDEELDGQMNDKQRALQAEIEHGLVAPCCWNMTVDQHESPASKQVRKQVAEMILTGSSKDEILDFFSAPEQYGERILATPSQKTLLGKSAYWLIPVVFLFGAGIVVLAIRRMSRVKVAQQNQQKRAKKQASASPDLSERVEEELKQLDA